jgi:hypothetical protein
MNLNPKITPKTLALLCVALAALFGILLAYEAINEVVNPRQDTVIDLCKPEEQRTTEGKAPCRWVIPAKYWPHKDLPRYFEVQVPWADIDPKFPVNAKAWVTFQFWPNDSGYANSMRWKQQNMGDQKPDNYGLLKLRDIAFYFKGFDGVEVEAQFFSSSFNSINPNMRIYRPLGKQGKTHWIVSLPILESEEAFELYFKQHIHEIDQKLMQFLDGWH